MAKIFMSMSGEGRGHATRVRSLVERMRPHHQITLFAPGDAHEFLTREYGTSSDVRLVEIPGLKFHYVNGRINLSKTIFEGLRFQQVTLPRVVRQLSEEIRTHQPAVILTDFEPALPRAARKCGHEYLSLTHQHFLVAYDLTWLPRKLQFFAWFIGLAVPLHYRHQKTTMISSFFTATTKPSWQQRDTVSVGPMIRPEVRQQALAAGIPVAENESDSIAEPPAQQDSVDSFLLSYLRKHTPERIVEELAKTGQRIKIYGVGQREPVAGLTFHAIDPQTFVDDLVACTGVVSAAGNQLLGECMYLGKPVLAIPEAWHHEQLINAYFLKRMGCGEFVTLEEFSADNVRNFEQLKQQYRTKIAHTCLGRDGTNAVVGLLEREADLHLLVERQR